MSSYRTDDAGWQNCRRSSPSAPGQPLDFELLAKALGESLDEGR